MQGKILIVDPIATNRIVLKVKLKKAYFDVAYATTMDEAVQVAAAERPDLVICALSLPEGSAAELCITMSLSPLTEHIPVIAIGCQPSAGDRMATLKAGVRDVLHQPVNETLLLGRVRQLIRAHNTAGEWRMRDDTCRALELAEPVAKFEPRNCCVMVGSNERLLQRYGAQLRPLLRAKLTLSTATKLMRQAADDTFPDVFVLILPEDRATALEDLRLIATLRANAHACHTGVIVLQTQADADLGAQALDLGADDLMAHGFDAVELALRISSVIRRKQMGDQLRASVQNGLQAAVFDPLTGLYNRRYAMPHLERIAQHARSAKRSFAILAADLDHFKQVNDAYGHASGDAVLVDVGHRLRKAVRPTDMVARIGGEEFMVILPGTSMAEAQKAALRICRDISGKPFVVPGSRVPITVTISIGMTIGGEAAGNVSEDGRTLLEEADRALYAAKGGGRNQVTLGRPAA